VNGGVTMSKYVLTQTEARVLKALDRNPDSDLSDLAGLTGLTPSQLSGVVAHLQERDLVKMIPARKGHVVLTQKGTEASQSGASTHASKQAVVLPEVSGEGQGAPPDAQALDAALDDEIGRMR